MMGEGRKAELKSQPWRHFQLHSLCSRNPGPVPAPGVSVAGKGQHLPVLFRIQLQGRAWLAWVIWVGQVGQLHQQRPKTASNRKEQFPEINPMKKGTEAEQVTVFTTMGQYFILQMKRLKVRVVR